MKMTLALIVLMASSVLAYDSCYELSGYDRAQCYSNQREQNIQSERVQRASDALGQTMRDETARQAIYQQEYTNLQIINQQPTHQALRDLSYQNQ